MPDLAGLARFHLPVDFHFRLRNRVFCRAPALAETRDFEKLEEFYEFLGKRKRDLFHRHQYLLGHAPEFFKNSGRDLFGRKAKFVELGIAGAMLDELVRKSETFKPYVTNIFFFQKL